MTYSTQAPESSATVATRSNIQRALVRTLLPALALGAGVWLAPSDASAAPRCTSKPAVCARIANERKARPQPAPVVATPAATPVAANTTARCTSKPIVCARVEQAGGLRAAQPPVTLARTEATGDRCTSKPAVCARLKMKAKAPPMTLAADQPR